MGLQAAGKTLLEYSLQSMIVRNAVGQGESRLPNLTQESGIQEGAGRDCPIGIQPLLLQHDDVGQMLVGLADIAKLDGGGIPKLVLNAEVPGLMDRGT